MNTWVLTDKSGKILTVMVARDKPAGGAEFLKYPAACDLSGPGNVAGTNISEYDGNGNRLPAPVIEGE